jgi:hypothetical protein
VAPARGVDVLDLLAPHGCPELRGEAGQSPVTLADGDEFRVCLAVRDHLRDELREVVDSRPRVRKIAHATHGKGPH